MEARSRLAELDALRGIAVLMVLAYHYTTRFGELFPDARWGEFAFGAYGVHLFFVISGFVIFMTLDRSARPLDFVLARFSRLYPAYWTGVLATAMFLALVDGPIDVPSPGQVLANLTMLQSFLGVPSVDGVYWTLEVELLFYGLALGAFAFGLLRRVELPLLAWLLAAALYLTPFWKSHMAPLPLSGLAARLLILEYAPFFALGVLFYRVYRGQGRGAGNALLIFLALALVAAGQPLSVALLIGGACLVLWRLAYGGIALLRCRPLLFFGTISYSLYLVHQKIGHALIAGLAADGVGPALRVGAATLVAVALATLITFSIERPAMRRIRGWYQARRRPAAVTARPAAT